MYVFMHSKRWLNGWTKLANFFLILSKSIFKKFHGQRQTLQPVYIYILSAQSIVIVKSYRRGTVLRPNFEVKLEIPKC